MYGSISPSDPSPEPTDTNATSYATINHQRARGLVAASFKHDGAATRIDRLRQSGCGKARLPNTFGSDFADLVTINTSGGLTGGDRLDCDLSLARDAQVRVTTQACEKIYRSLGSDAHVANRITIAEGAALHWLPQETIFFDRGALSRELTIDMAPDATLLALEPVVFGRGAMGETEIRGRFFDRWRVRIGDRLRYAEDGLLEGAMTDQLRSAIAGKGAAAFVAGVYVGTDLEARRDGLRAALAEICAFGVTWGCSLVRGILSLRAVAPDSLALRRWIAAVYDYLGGRPLPRAWSC
ncbi:MAG: urease accessory protein UreD [Alphaproteobacteria bacterium]|nr:urease accessory protein UreD [Alphaproteobacteria bacterium]